MKTSASNDISELYEILKNIHQQNAAMNKEIAEMKKELDHHIRKTNKESEVIGSHVTETTQVNPLLGRTIYCPHCAHPNIVYSFAWSTIKCQNKECQDLIDKYDWLI